MKDSLIKKKINDMLCSDSYKNSLIELAKRVIAHSKCAPNEATIESNFDCELFSFFREHFGKFGFSYNPIKEASLKTRRHISKGRADTAIASLVVEFKQPSTLSNDSMKERAVKQISDYLASISENSDQSLEGFVTDGVIGCFITYFNSKFNVEHFYELDFYSLDRIVRNILELKMMALNARNLVEVFCGNNGQVGVAINLTRCLFSTLKNTITPKTQMLFNEWKELFKLAHDDTSQQQAIINRRQSLENVVQSTFLDNNEEYMALFALQTAYAIIVKSIAYKVLSICRRGTASIDFYDCAEMNSDQLCSRMETLENGEIFRKYNITNLLEGDFFSWYSSNFQWNNDIFNNVVEVFNVLSKFSDRGILNNVSKAQDFFKDLYQSLVPPAVRHSLGEYYTKKWLASNVIKHGLDILGKDDWKALDPCCGSGTFLTALIESIKEKSDKRDLNLLIDILSRVKGIDLNPLAVLTARVNYFLNIAPLLDSDYAFEIPVYLGDSSYVPSIKNVDGVDYYDYTISTLKKPIHIVIPSSTIKDALVFSQTMTKIEVMIKAKNIDAIYSELLSITDDSEKNGYTHECLWSLADQFVYLEKENWNGIWARIVTNFLTTASLGKFDLIVGNPPWVDWKSLPLGYRNRIKSLCISRQLFSGDAVTGGICLNICALITNIVCKNWLIKDGVLGFLMPEQLIFQQSYEGFRKLYLDEKTKLYFNLFINWNKAGRPFKPVTQKFLTYYISYNESNYFDGVKTICYEKKTKRNIDDIEELSVDDTFLAIEKRLVCRNRKKNFFTYESIGKQSEASVGGESFYVGREGIEFYPQELMLFKRTSSSCSGNVVHLENYQNPKSKYKLPKMEVLLEKDFLHPLIKGKGIIPFHAEITDFIVPFPYDKENPQKPIGIKELAVRAPKLASHYLQYKNIILEQTRYNEKIIGKKDAEFYAMARVGAYSFANNYVVFRDNTKWAAAVVSEVDTEWGGKKRPLFQNHAVSICEDINGRFISLEEAHYICAILNSPQVYTYMMNSSDSRSFPIRIRITLPKYNSRNKIHKKLSDLSITAHKCFLESDKIASINKEIERLYSKLLKKEMNNE